jgi:IclR family acetate operon transcriptional repressor
VAPLSEALQEAPGSLGTVRNAVLLLDLLAEGPAYQQLTDLADRSGLSLPTVHRLLRSLVLAGLVEQDPRSSRYGLGAHLVRLAHRYLARLPVLGALAPYLAQLRDAVGATVRVELLVGTQVVDGDRVSGPEVGLYREVAGVRPALSTAGGRALAARGDDELWKLVMAEADEELRALAESEREAWSKAEVITVSADYLGAGTEVAVAVVDPSGSPLAALCVDLPRDPAPERVRETVAHCDRAIAAALRTLGHG